MDTRLVILSFYLLAGLFLETTAASEKQRLYSDLMRESYVVVRPVQDHNTATNVHIGLRIINILELNRERQELVTQCWITMTWKDETLMWDPAEYGDITQMHVEPNNIWTPDIILYNGLDDLSLRTKEDYLAIIQSDGTVLWIPPVTIHSICYASPDSDEHLCKFKFGSWTYNGNELDINLYLNKTEAESDTMVEGSHIELLESSANKTIVYYSCCPEPYPSVTFFIKIKSGQGRVLASSLVMMVATLLTANWL